ncbi:MAG: YvcK family protein [Candidatus Caenarcaniphilales bacterium]|nr:YvcK family protein [Candidatus Caenarcaniphilales bacterium]
MPKLNKIRLSNKYFLPGLKRWIITLIIGILFIIFGVALLLKLRPLTTITNFIWDFLRWIADLVPAHISGPVILILGGAFVASSLLYMLKTMVDVTFQERSSLTDKSPSNTILQALEKASRKGQGPKIVAIGGGTGLSTLLRGIKSYSNNITAIVTVGDDGGSSGRLREELKVVPPGDIRNCIVALSDEEEVTTSIFQYRFTEGTLKGHSLGNLFLAALCDLSGDMSKASQVASRILRTGGTVLPSSVQAIHLSAEMEDGSIVEGESNIPDANKKIKKVFADSLPPALPESVEAIKDADMILLGPGSLYTSIIPNLLFPEIVAALRESQAKVFYVSNLVQDKETRGYNVLDCVNEIISHSGKKIIDTVLVNNTESWDLPKGKPIQVDYLGLSKLGIEVVTRPKLHNNLGRHNPLRLGRSIMQWFNLRQAANRRRENDNNNHQTDNRNRANLKLINQSFR